MQQPQERQRAVQAQQLVQQRSRKRAEEAGLDWMAWPEFEQELQRPLWLKESRPSRLVASMWSRLSLRARSRCCRLQGRRERARDRYRRDPS